MKKTIFSLIMLIHALSTQAQIYVATDGDDENGAGGKSNPVYTIRKAAELATAGDTIWLRGGVYGYTQNQNISAFEGNETAWLTIKAYPGEEPILDGSKQSNGGNESVFSFWNCTYCCVDGLTIRNSTGRGITVSISHHMAVRNCTVHDVQTRGIGCSGSDILIENNEVYNAVMENENQTYPAGGWAAAVSTYSNYETGEACRDITIRGNYIYNSWGEGIIPMRGHNIVIENNRVANCFSVGIYPGNLVNCTVRGNHIWFDDTTYLRDGERPMTGIMWNIENWGYSIGEYGVDGLQIYNNLIVNTEKALAWYEEGNEKYNTYRNVKIYHNTCRGSGKHAFYLYDVQEGAPEPYGNECYNNIFDKGAELASAASAWTFSHNLWAEGMPAQGTHSNSLSGDALLAGNSPAQAESYKLTLNSPAKDAGKVVETVTTDFWGGTRDQTPDMGFHEYGSVANMQTMERPDNTFTAYHNGHSIVAVISGPSHYQLFDVNGRMLLDGYSASGTELIIPAEYLSAGLYFIRAEDVHGHVQRAKVQVVN